jgi:hypothetical protein
MLSATMLIIIVLSFCRTHSAVKISVITQSVVIPIVVGVASLLRYAFCSTRFLFDTSLDRLVLVDLMTPSMVSLLRQ